MSAQPAERSGAAETVGGFLAAAALFVGLLALVYRPARVAPAAMLVALVAVAIGGRHSRLAAFALAASAVAFVAGMTISILTDRPLY